MNKTTNYQLNQWEPEDQVRRTDFNEDNAKLDAALAGLESGKADKTALAAAQTALTKQISQVDAAMVRMVFGTYTGTGTSSQHIELGQQPKAVLVFRENGSTSFFSTATRITGGLTLPGYPVVYATGTALETTASGFRAYNSNSYILCNDASVNYHYIAFV